VSESKLGSQTNLGGNISLTQPISQPKDPRTKELVFGSPMKFAVFCSGRGSNLKAILKAADEDRLGGAEPVVMVADSHYAEAINVAREFGVYATFIPRTAYHANREGFEKRLLEVLKPLKPDLIVLAGFQRILGPVFLSAFPQRVINIHPALLPSFPGHSVWSKELDYGVKLVGPTVHFVDDGVDTGPIIIQGVVPVLDDDDVTTLAARILTVEHRILPQSIRWLAQGRVEITDRKVSIKRIPDIKMREMIWPPLEWDF
jgi:phosphoribosylglycinamide formyltransferase-1